MPSRLSELLKHPRKMLTNIEWDETSGVDHPANEEEGWMVMKNVGASVEDVLEEVLKAEAVRVEKQELLLASLTGGDFSDAPDDVKGAVTKLQTWLKAEGYEIVEPKVEKVVESEVEEKVEKETTFIPAKKLMSVIASAIRAAFRHKAVDKAATEKELMKAIKDNWAGFLSTVAEILGSDEDKITKKNKLQQAVYELADVVRNTPAWDIK